MSENASDEALAEPEAETLVFDVSEEDAGTRLDAFLAARVASVSRTALKRAIEDGDALVDGRAAKPSHKLRAGEHVEVELPAPPTAELTPEDIPLDIIYEDDDVVVVNKPAGMVVHPAAGVRTGTLANALAYRFSGLRIADCGLRIDESNASSADAERSGGRLQDTANPKSEIRNPQSDRRLHPRPARKGEADAGERL